VNTRSGTFESLWTDPRKRQAFLSILAMCLVCLAIPVYLRWNRPVPIPLLGPKTETIVPGVHMIRGLGPSVAYVIETTEGPVLIDAGLEADAATLKEEMAKLLLDWHAIKAILLTHVHGDHCGGAQHLRSTTQAKVYAGQGDADVLLAGGPKESFFSAFYMPKDSPHKTPVDVRLKGSESLVFGDVSIKVVATPGHTPGSMCYLIKKGGKRLFFSGDVIMHLGSEKPLGTYSAYLAPKYRGDPKTYLTSLQAMKAMKAPDLVLPGHPPLGTNPDDPRMSPKRWAAIMDEGIRDMETLITRYTQDGLDFLDGNAKQLLPGLFYLGDLSGISVYAIVADGQVILIDAPGGDLFEFVTGRLKTLKIEPAIPTAVWLTSCDEARIKGLKNLIEMTHASVVTSKRGLDILKDLLPADAKRSAAEDLAGHSPFSAHAISLRSRDLAPTAYVLRIAEKTVLISGRIPIKFGEEAMANITEGPPESREVEVDTLSSLSQLEPIKPDVWLPSTPWHGQNANLYDQDWADVIASNYKIEYFKLRKANAAGRAKGLSALPSSGISLQ
jgi:glyoxylase-like metal-dependent hydrolase (beta-lactamase superfamily II)